LIRTPGRFRPRTAAAALLVEPATSRRGERRPRLVAGPGTDRGVLFVFVRGRPRAPRISSFVGKLRGPAPPGTRTVTFAFAFVLDDDRIDDAVFLLAGETTGVFITPVWARQDTAIQVRLNCSLHRTTTSVLYYCTTLLVALKDSVGVMG